jgi:hypothetical protein
MCSRPLFLRGEGVTWLLLPAIPQGWRCDLHMSSDRLCVVKSNILQEVTLLAPNTADLKEYNLDTKNPILRCVRPCLRDVWQRVSLP